MADRIKERVARIVLLRDMFYDNLSGYLATELAERLKVSLRSIERDLALLQADPLWVPLICEHRRWRLMVENMSKLPPLRLTQQEATALFVAGRLLDQVSDEPNPYIGLSLQALAHILQPQVAEQLRRVLSPRMGEQDSPYARVFDAIARAWVTRRCVRIRYRAAGREEERETVLSPYWIESSPEEMAAYVIGHASHAGELRIFKLERILEAQLLQDCFVVPPDFDALELLSSAWGIMYGETTQEVLLRFAPAAARRLAETRWNRSASIETLPDGRLLYRVSVAHPEEMHVFIRRWGPQVEVLSPAWLREEMANEAREMAAQYGEISPG